MEQLPAPDQGRRTFAGLSPRMTAFVAFDALLLLAFLIALVLFVTGPPGGSNPDAGSAPSPGTTTSGAAPTTGESPKPSSAPAAKGSATFALPSGNIACKITTDAATCTVANSSATPPADSPCAASVGHVLTVTRKGAEMPCVEGALPGVAAPDTSVLEYGQSTTAGDFTCTSSSTGVTCKHDPTGKGFQLAREGSKLF